MKQHTIIFVPHARAKFRKLRFSSIQAWLVLGTLAVLTLGGVLAMVSLARSTVDQQQLADLRTENETLREVNRGFETSIRKIETQVQDYQNRIHQLAIVAGISELGPGPEAGIGGSHPIMIDGELGLAETDSDMGSSLSELVGQLSRMDEQTGLLQEELEADALTIASTPAIAPVKGLYSSGFGYRSDPFTGTRTFHQGIDITAPHGKAIVASGDGIVVKAERLRGLGRAVYIAHGFGITTRYGHMSRLAVEAGQRVSRGDVIGYVGSSGRSTGNHLHYEVHVDGKAKNPLPYIFDSIAP